MPKIHDLPDELLAQILGLVVRYPTRSWWAPDFDKYFRNSISVMLVCHRFHRLATPCLYRHIEVAAGWVGPNFPGASPRGTELLRRTLSEDSSLRENCRVLHVHIGAYDSDPPPRTAEDFVTWLVRTKCLQIDGGFFSRPSVWDNAINEFRPVEPSALDYQWTWHLIRTAVRNMTSLEELSLMPGSGLLSLETTIDMLRDAARLKILNLAGISFTGFTLPESAFKIRSASVTSVILSNFQDTSQNLGRFLLFPAMLEKFSFGSLRLNRTGPWTLSAMANAVFPHRETLRTLLIGSLPECSMAGFDLSEFTALEELSLSYWATGCEAGTEAQLLAPRLRKFIWSFHAEEEQSESYFDFQKPQETWLRTFVHTAVHRGVPLCEIHITFDPSDYGKPGEARPSEWPWDCMERIGGEMRAVDMSLSYDKPSISRQAFYELSAPL